MPQERRATFSPDQKTTASHAKRMPLPSRFWGALGLAAAALFMGACDTDSTVAPATAKADQPTVWNDPDLPNRPDRGLTSLMLRFDPQHDPAGSVRMEVCFNKPGDFRVVSEEVSPRPGVLVDEVFKHEAKCYPDLWPVSPIDVGDVEKVYIGVGDTPEDLSKVREYGVERTGAQTLEIEPRSLQSIGGPGTLNMRDAQKTP